MTDKEAKSCIQTITLLRQLAYNIHGFMDIIDEQNCEKVIALMKEQEAVVRCKDCCMGEPYPRETGKTWCHLMSEPHKDDWYCADGTRKDGENNVSFSD